MSRHTPAHDLWAAYRSAPCRRTRDRLAVRYRPLVRRVAHRTAQRLPDHVDHADLMQSGMFGLSTRSSVSTPAVARASRASPCQRIQGAILDELRAQDWVPRAVAAASGRPSASASSSRCALRRTATDREIAAEMGVPLRELRAAGGCRVLSVEALRAGAGGSVLDTFADAEPDPEAPCRSARPVGS